MIFKEKDPAEVEAALKAMVSIAYVCFNYTYEIYRSLAQLVKSCLSVCVSACVLTWEAQL